MRHLYFILLAILVVSSVQAKERLYPHLLPSDGERHPAVIICPGGSYSWHDMQHEGIEVAEWLNSQGMHAFVLKYRVVGVAAYCTGYRVLGLGHKYPDMLDDMEEALSYVYTHADSLGIDTARIGVMGFSAGGHLTMMSWTHNRTIYKPKFLVPVYPVVTMSDPVLTHRRSRRAALGIWHQWNTEMRDSLSIEKCDLQGCPPVLLINCMDDPIVHYQNSERLDSALTIAGVPHLYKQYKTGGHGFGACNEKGTDECRQWKNLFIQWISNISL